MLRLTRRTSIAPMLAAAFVLALAPAAVAAHTTITVGGAATPDGPVPITAANTSTVTFESNFGVETNCDTMSTEGEILRGAPVTIGARIGEITNLSSVNCTKSSLNLPVVFHSQPGDIVVRAHPASPGDPIPVTIENIAWKLHSTGGQPWACEIFLDGSVDATLTPATGGVDAELSLASSGQDLDLTTGDGFGNRQTTPGSQSCGGWWYEPGDVAGPLGGDFDVSTNGAGAISHG
ncbi:hypothetical protein ACHAAC_08070 [Aeromicrobium sp. CF4.19]|uniref:hypothetical protein n=1 Tax=Aeromicrobium sp. CF4.19 TaxID=3373082 RepID=UPI003EE5F1F1